MTNRKYKYFVRHEVYAKNANEARKLSLKREPDEIYKAEEESEGGSHAIGFHADTPDDDWE